MRRANPAVRLTAAQDRIIDVLRKLLDVARLAQAEVLAEMKKRPGGDLPDDAKHKLEEIRKKLDKFLAEQKKIIEASENLAKTPVEDFSAKEEELLKRMAAAEDDWAKFMKDLHSDLSKLPEQDFANSSMAKELVEIQTELKMAEDALLKKSVRHRRAVGAVGLREGRGTEDELREVAARHPRPREMEPGGIVDRQGQRGPDGRIADGTGGYGRRSDGEGRGSVRRDGRRFQQRGRFARQGRRLGRRGRTDLEHEREGRHRQPPAQYQRNRRPIAARDDRANRAASSSATRPSARAAAKRPAGSRPIRSSRARSRTTASSRPAAPPAAARRAARGAKGSKGRRPATPVAAAPNASPAKQAELRNKAESIDLKFQVANFHHTDLKKMIEVMAQVERDVKAGRYKNALRQRKVLAEGFRNVKQYLEGEFEVRKDSTSNLPTDIQKEILGAMQDPSPAGWEELNRQYFDRLSGGGEETKPPESGEGGKRE